MATAEMEYRTLGGSGLKCPCCASERLRSAETGEFFEAWGSTDVAGATRLVDVCLDAGLTMFDSADVYSDGRAEEILGAGHPWPPRSGAHLDQGDVPDRPGSQRRRLVPALPAPRRRGQPPAPGHRLHRPVSAARVRCDDAGRGGVSHAGPPRAGGQDSLRRVLELLGLAPDEVAGRGRRTRMVPLRGAPGLLLAGRPRLRVGADAAGARSEQLARWCGARSAGGA